MLSYPPAPTLSLAADEDLRYALEKALRHYWIRHVVETGTHHGTGSTRFVWNVFRHYGIAPESFVTIEVDHASWSEATKNLADTTVRCRWGLSVKYDDAVLWVQTDPMLEHPEFYPDVYGDGDGDMRSVYLEELRGALFGIAPTERPHDNLLVPALLPIRTQHPLVILDSAGGIGLLEFHIVASTLADQSYLLLLDDIHHVKHVRSMDIIRGDPHWTVLYEGTAPHAAALCHFNAHED